VKEIMGMIDTLFILLIDIVIDGSLKVKENRANRLRCFLSLYYIGKLCRLLDAGLSRELTHSPKSTPIQYGQLIQKDVEYQEEDK
jgi:hypothetical protein